MTTSAIANLRAEPDCEGPIVVQLGAGATVEITGIPSNSWYPVRADDLEGWIAGSLLTGPGIPDIPEIGCAPPAPIATTTGPARLRATPSCTGIELRMLAAGVEVEIVNAPENDWYPVEIDGESGWVAGSLLAGADIPGIGAICGASAAARPSSQAPSERPADPPFDVAGWCQAWAELSAEESAQKAGGYPSDDVWNASIAETASSCNSQLSGISDLPPSQVRRMAATACWDALDVLYRQCDGLAAQY